MNKGSPGGILLIAFGVLFLRLAYTGRIGEVWKTLISGNTGEDLGDTGNVTGVPACPKCPVVDCTNAVYQKDCNPPYQWCQCNGVAGCCKGFPGSTAGEAIYHTFNAAGAPYLTAAGNIR